jgi:hypothetical protein
VNPEAELSENLSNEPAPDDAEEHEQVEATASGPGPIFAHRRRTGDDRSPWTLGEHIRGQLRTSQAEA